MRLTSFTDFALRALMRLAGEPGRSFATNEIAAEFGISRNHLAKVVRDLADSGFISTQRGVGGGFTLARPAQSITHRRSGAGDGRTGAGRMFSGGWRLLRAEAALPAEGETRRRARSLHAGARFLDTCGMRLSRDGQAKPGTRVMTPTILVNRMKPIEFENGAVQIDAAIVAEGLGLAPSLLQEEMRAGRITSLAERGVDADSGRHRLTFFSEHRRFRVVVDETGAIIQRSAVDFGNSSLPKSVHKPGG